MTTVIAVIHLVPLMNADWVRRDSQDMFDFGFESLVKVAAFHMHHHHFVIITGL